MNFNKHFKRQNKRYKTLTAVMTGLLFLAGGAVVSVYMSALMLGAPDLTVAQNTIYYDANGAVISEEQGTEQRYWIDLEDMSDDLVKATVLTEDKDFYNHNGFELKRIIGALWADLKAGSLKQGASTLTQQYARNLYLSYEKSWTRKLKEAFYTIRLEMYYDKDELLEGYLNTIYYGHGAYGVEAASRLYFDKSASDLDLAEAAMLAGIPKGPSYYSPMNDLERAKNRQLLILGNMADAGVITDEAKFLAEREDFNFDDDVEEIIEKAPYFQDVVLNEAEKILDVDVEGIRSGGYKIYTTLDLDKQEEMRTSVDDVFADDSDLQVGAMAMDVDNGAIRAMIGGRDYEASQYNRAVQSRRMPGSSFKPIVYYTALEKGYTPVTMLKSAPTEFAMADGETYSPHNFNNYYAYDDITMAQALALSDNIFAVKTNIYVGPDSVIDTARRLGIKSDLLSKPSLALGTGAVSVGEMVQAYGIIANGGKRIFGHTIEKIVNKTGDIVYLYDGDSGADDVDAGGDGDGDGDGDDEASDGQVLDAKKAYILTHMMTGIFDHALDGYMQVTGSGIKDELTRTYAGKTGTTDGDSWMIGYSPGLVAGVWTGYDDNRDMENIDELRYAKNVWAGFMEGALSGEARREFPVPDGVIGVMIDPESGKLATNYCPVKREMFFEKDDMPEEVCQIHDGPVDIPDVDDGGDGEDKGLLHRIWDWLF